MLPIQPIFLVLGPMDVYGDQIQGSKLFQKKGGL